MSILKILKVHRWATPSIVSFLNQVIQIPLPFHHEPYFLDFWTSQILSSDSPAVQHPPLIKAPGTGHDLPAESSPGLQVEQKRQILPILLFIQL